MAIKFEDYLTIKAILENAQEVESDNREFVREAHLFVDKRDGQWEPSIIQQMTDRPRYTFDKVNPIIDDIAGEMEQADFAIRVRPAGGDASMDTAKTMDGLIRNIENISNATHIYNAAGREMITGGLGGWEVVQDWADSDAFDQDLFIKPIPNFEDRVWFDTGSELQDRSDARFVFVLENLTKDEYKSRFPKGSGTNIGEDKKFQAYQQVPDFITIARFIYKKPKKKQLVLMSNGAIYERTPDFEQVIDELQAAGITIEQEREKESLEVFSRLMDGGGWLTPPEKTVFKDLPVVVTYGNFKIREKKITYRGVVEKLLDPQRTYNFLRSREVEEVALAPRSKYWMTRKQAQNENDRQRLQTMNTNADPVQFFTPDEALPGVPQQSGGAVVNPGLQTAIQSSQQDIVTTGGRTGVQSGDVEGPLSGIAIQKLQNKADNAHIKYFTSQEIAICCTGKILLGAIPVVYDTRRTQRIVNEDGTTEMVTLNDTVFDQQTNQFVELNNMAKGLYDVVCDVGPAFKNRQQESVKALQELSQVVPGLAELTADIQLKNIPTPGVELAAERVRNKLFEAGAIPESQLTDEERQLIQQAQEQAAQAQQQEQQPNPVEQALVQQTQAQTADIMSKAQERADKTRLKEVELSLKQEQQLFNAQNEAEQRDIQELKLSLQQQQQQFEQQMESQKQIIELLNTQAQTLKTLREAQGVDTFTGPHTQEAFIQQAEMVTEGQDRISDTPETAEVTDRLTQQG